VRTVSGFDLSPFNRFAEVHHYRQKSLRSLDYRFLTAPFPVFEFNFEQVESIGNADQEYQCQSLAQGICHAIAFWFRLDLGEGIYLDTGPQSPSTCWMQAVQVLPEPLPFRQGQMVRLQARHDCSSISFLLHL